MPAPLLVEAHRTVVAEGAVLRAVRIEAPDRQIAVNAFAEGTRQQGSSASFDREGISKLDALRA